MPRESGGMDKALTTSRDDNCVRLTRSNLIAMLQRDMGKPPLHVKCVVVEAEKGDELINISDADGIVISWIR